METQQLLVRVNLNLIYFLPVDIFVTGIFILKQAQYLQYCFIE